MNEANIDTYMGYNKESFIVTDKSNEIINIFTDYSNCKVLILHSEFIILANCLKSEFDCCNKFKCAAIVSGEAILTKLALRKNDTILHGLYIPGKI